MGESVDVRAGVTRKREIVVCELEAPRASRRTGLEVSAVDRHQVDERRSSRKRRSPTRSKRDREAHHDAFANRVEAAPHTLGRDEVQRAALVVVAPAAPVCRSVVYHGVKSNGSEPAAKSKSGRTRL